MERRISARHLKIVCSIGLALLVFAGLSVTVLRPIWATPHVSLEAKKSGEEVSFKVRVSNARGPLQFRVIDTKAREVLWSVDLNRHHASDLIYGRVPQPGDHSIARQEFPESDRPPVALPEGKEVLIVVRYQYDRYDGPVGGWAYFGLIIEPAGAVRTWETQRGPE